MYVCTQHYEGVKNGFVSPYELANCDVVLVSYETLSLELNYAKSHEGRVYTAILRGCGAPRRSIFFIDNLLLKSYV